MTTESERQTALQDFGHRVRRHYGRKLSGLHIIHRQDHWEDADEPDLEIVVVLEGAPDLDRETEVISDLTYDCLVATRAFVLAHPVRQSQWSSPTDPDICEMKDCAAPMLELT